MSIIKRDDTERRVILAAARPAARGLALISAGGLLLRLLRPLKWLHPLRRRPRLAPTPGQAAPAPPARATLLRVTRRRWRRMPDGQIYEEGEEVTIEAADNSGRAPQVRLRFDAPQRHGEPRHDA